MAIVQRGISASGTANGANIIYYQTKSAYDKAKEDLVYLEKSNVLPHEEVVAAVVRLNEAWANFINMYESYIPLNRMMVASIPPPVDRHNRRGIIAFREWKSPMIEEGKLHSLVMGMHCEWTPIMYADRIPVKDNTNGLYAREITPKLCVGFTWYGHGDIWGFVELTGHIEEHTDGVYRAERAEVLVLYVPVNDDNLNAKLCLGALKSLKDSFFPVPVYPVTPDQSDLIIMREVLISAGVSTY